MGRNACSFLLHKSHFIIYKTLPLCHKSRKEAKEDFCTTHHKLPGLKSMLIPMNNVWILQRFESKRILAKSLYFFFDKKRFFSLADLCMINSIHHLEQHLIDVRMTRNTKRASMLYVSHIYRKSILLYFTLCQQFYKLAWPLPCTNNIFQPLRAKELKAQHSLKRDLGNICILKIRTELLTFGANVVVWIGGLRKSRNWFCPFCIDFQ